MSSFPQFSPTSLFDVSSLVIVITGGGSGLGRDMACALVSNGATVFGVGRTVDSLSETEEMLKNERGRYVGIQGDVSTKEGIQAIFKAVSEQTDHVDVLINNAGIARTVPRATDPSDIEETVEKLMDTSFDDFAAVSAINVTAPYFLTIQFIPLLDKAEQPLVLFNASAAAVGISGSTGPIYATSKAAALHLSRLLASRLIPFKIRVNTLLLTIFPSGLTGEDPSEQPWAAALLKLTPAARFGDRQDLAGAILFLCSRAGQYVSGSSLTLDGGRLLLNSAHEFLPASIAAAKAQAKNGA